MIGEIVRIALTSIMAHKLRTFLTLLGVIIGVASVVVVAAGLSGTEAFVLESVSKALGSNSFVLAKIARLGNVSDEEFQRMVKRNRDLKLHDLDFLRTYCSHCDQITAELSSVHTTYAGAREQQGTTVRGATANMIFLRNFDIEAGRFFSNQEERAARYVCVVGRELKTELFPTVDPVGKFVKINGQPLKVVGVMEELGSNFGQSQDNVLYLPITAYQKIFGARRSILIRGNAASRETFGDALDQVRVAMRIRHKLKPGEEDDFGLISTDEINDVVSEFANAVALVVLPITAVSLLVGGIVIMNIMLVSVTERTFEIGIRKAMGARRADILYQFLIEAFFTAALGGMIGLLLASGVARLVESGFSFPMEIEVWQMLLAVLFSGGIGIIFGMYPAMKASKLDPIIAMTEGR